jgi:hypothetical protein
VVIYQLDVMHTWSNQPPQKSVDEKSSPSVVQIEKSIVIHKPQNGLGGI